MQPIGGSRIFAQAGLVMAETSHIYNLLSNGRHRMKRGGP
jgi:hypothetical protein